MTFLSLTEERLMARLRLIVLTIVEYVELTMWYWEGGREGGTEGGRDGEREVGGREEGGKEGGKREGRGKKGWREEGREICSIVCYYLSTVGKNCFSFVKGVCYRILGSEKHPCIHESKLEPCLHN